ncbi:valine--tRNA ligase [Sphingomonas gilva]|uniref:Valine--tRNA ligase n=1 Tax=Sphingomonas gilva TaxID=2305907 RepID=A0A396RKG4_9SPHN|nr:valine--tRNA ligase [Sphingomonas gilva]RHW16700.1 valine--tRNA ligase [Sphingomonas gilva]
MTELAKTFDPATIEPRWYAHWEEKGLFRPDRPTAEPWTLVNPPPNVTGSLHIGHALDNTLQDVMTRYERLRGKDARWVVGTDHAGIATQMVVERNLASQGIDRREMGREAFLDHVWEWKAQSGGQITRQLRRLGCSMDWSDERFTMDEGFSAAVLKVFAQLHREGLLYRDKRLVNWDPKLGTAISDLEVETREVQGKFWHLTYPLADGSGSVSVATTRPETMLADIAVAVHPDDPRYTALIGKEVRLPITGRLVPIVADAHADPELGSGAVKITPGHDFNDFEVARRAGVQAGQMLNMLGPTARVCQTADGLIPEELLGLDRFEARTKVVEMLDASGHLERVEDRVIQTPFGDRSGVVIEPWLTDQWYVDAATLAQPAIEAVRSGAIEIVPKTWEKTFFNWMENIQPWCVSRQLWWGHRIPAWYGPVLEGDTLKIAPGDRNAQRLFVAESEEAALAEMCAYYGEGRHVVIVEDDEEAVRRILADAGGERVEVYVTRDSDVLDTWFSSALWPFATIGWPEKEPSPLQGRGLGEGDFSPSLSSADRPLSPEGARETLSGRYPNDLLISGFDILFFWDARMMMQGMHFLGDVPFKRLYLHGLVRAADGQKMSKSKGNTVDPLGLIDRYGADALRFFMAAMESQGRDIKMDERRVEGYRNFATKLWNAARFCQSNGIGASTSLEPPAAAQAVNKWIIGETVKTVQAVDLALADLRFDAAANAIYQFVWSRFCDWYLELIKGAIDEETKTVAGWVIDQILVMLHPFMPFITEELWHAMGERPYDLIVAKWPMADARAIDPVAAREVDWLMSLVSEIRTARTELNIPPSARTDLWVDSKFSIEGMWGKEVPAEPIMALFSRHRSAFAKVARLKRLDILSSNLALDLETGEEISRKDAPVDARSVIQIVSNGVVYMIPLEGVIDLDAERTRLEKGIAAAAKERDALAGRLNNPSFVERAKPEAVEKARADHADKAAEAERLTAALERLG